MRVKPVAAVAAPHLTARPAQRIQRHLFMIAAHAAKPRLMQQREATCTVGTSVDQVTYANDQIPLVIEMKGS